MSTHQIPMTKTVFPVKDFISWYKQKQLDLKPPFQRNDVWQQKSKSFLIDTIIRGLPLPIIILRDKPGLSLEPQREVVDGQQRLTAILTFVLYDSFPQNKHFLIDKAHYSEFSGMGFYDLPDDVKASVLDYQISTHILPSSVDDKQVLRIFSRLNSTGYKLNDQELRNAEYYGDFKNCVLELGLKYLSFWRSSRLFNDDDIARMKETQFTATLVSYMLRGLTATNKTQLDNLYKQFDDDFPLRAEVQNHLSDLLDEIESGLGTAFSKTSFSNTSWFYVLFAVLYDYIYEFPLMDMRFASSRKTLPRDIWSKVKSVDERIRNGENLPAESAIRTSVRTTNINVRQVRIKFLRESIF